MNVRLRAPDGSAIAVAHGMRIGRDPHNELVLDSGAVSRRHAVLVQLQGRMAIHDEHSTNGTFVNEQRVQGTVGLAPGDAIRIGSFTLIVEADTPPAPYSGARQAPAFANQPPRRLKPRRFALGRITGIYVLFGAGLLALLIVLGLTTVPKGKEPLVLPTPVAVLPPATLVPAAPTPVPVAAVAADWSDLFEQVAPNVLVVTNTNASATGTAFFVDERHALTNAHVVTGATSVRVNGLAPKGGAAPPARTARVLASDTTMDLAVLSLPDSAPSHLKLGALDKVRVGDEVMAIGEPRGLAWTATWGRVGAVRRGGDFDLNPAVTAVQFDAAINPGNSGGPLIARDGSVIGIVTFGMRNATGLSFAISGDALWSKAKDWIARDASR